MSHQTQANDPELVDEYEELIRNTLHTRLGREVVDVVPLRHHNARVYSLTLKEARGVAKVSQRLPGVHVLPHDTTKLIIRFSDPASMLNEEIRVQNEVAVMLLARQALEPLDPSLVPEVYDWQPFADGKGWTLIEYKHGVPLGDRFGELDAEKKRDILRQISRVFKHIQSFKLPDSVKSYGGLNFDKDGGLVGGPTPIAGGGPCSTLPELYAEYFRTQIGFADKCDIVQGWKSSGLRARLDRFGAEGLKAIAGKVDARPTLIHGDFDGNNILFDETTNKLTALLDYDFGHIGSQGDEYFYSFPRIHGLLVPPFIGDPDEDHLRECLLHGFTKDDAERKSEAVDWATAVVRDEEFAKAGVERPADIKGIAELSALYWFIQNISPPMFFLQRWRSKATPERIEMIRKDAKSQLEKNLGHWGF